MHNLAQKKGTLQGRNLNPLRANKKPTGKRQLRIMQLNFFGFSLDLTSQVTCE
jgi:hypothetical protein